MWTAVDVHPEFRTVFDCQTLAIRLPMNSFVMIPVDPSRARRPQSVTLVISSSHDYLADWQSGGECIKEQTRFKQCEYICFYLYY